MDVPDSKGRREILNVHARNKKLGPDVDLDEVAMRVPGFSGADLANLLNEVREGSFAGPGGVPAVDLQLLPVLWDPSPASAFEIAGWGSPVGSIAL